MLRDKLNRFSGDIVRSEENESRPEDRDRYSKIADCLDGKLCRYENGSFVKISTDFKDTYTHGNSMLLNLNMTRKFQRRHFYYNEAEIGLDSNDLLFCDMETTGLGGSGTVPFLIGLGSVKGAEFQVRQYFLPDYPDEEAMLEAVREEINDRTVLVTYNGKAFDIPILVDRLILHRVERNLVYADHIDLLHTARRMYRRRLQSCTLSNIEENILDFHRIDDIPGSLVPSIYFNWLNYDDPANLDGVVKHNLLDIISLFFLMHHFADIRSDPAGKISEPDDVLSLAKIIESGRNHAQVYRVLETFEGITENYDRHDILLLQSMAYKRSGKFTEAAAVWEKITGARSPESFPALIELAKYYEHRQKDLNKAIQCTINAQEMCPELPGIRTELKKRLKRLNSKLSRMTDKV